MIESITAAQIMIPLARYPRIEQTATLRQAIALMEGCQIVNRDGSRSAPRVLLVFGPADRLLGILRRRDIMRGLEPRFLVGGQPGYPRKLFDVKVDPNLSEVSYDHALGGIRRRAERRVSEVMIPIAVTINADDHLMKAMNEMVENNCSLLPVIDQGRVVGVLRSLDVLHEISDMIQSSNPPHPIEKED